MQFSRSIILDNGCYLFASELLPGTSKCVLSTCRLPDVLVLADECYQLAVIQQFISKWLPSTCNLHTSCLSKWVLSICSYLQQCDCELLLSTCIPPLPGIVNCATNSQFSATSFVPKFLSAGLIPFYSKWVLSNGSCMCQWTTHGALTTIP